MARTQVNLSLTAEEHAHLKRLAQLRSSKTKVVHLIYEAIEKTYFRDPPAAEVMPHGNKTKALGSR
jgi:hypothetical protein